MKPRVLLDGVGDVTSEVSFSQTELSIGAGNSPSPSYMTIRNLGGPAALGYVVGKRVTIDLEGVCFWSGYVMKPSRRFWYDVDDSTKLHRRWVLNLLDVSTLFRRRFVKKNSAPNTIYAPVYANPTYDDTIVDELTSNWLDIAGDDIDVSTYVNRVAIVNPSASCSPSKQNFIPWQVGMNWGDAMGTIAVVPAAIWALLPGAPLGSSPFARLVYADVDVLSAPYALSDEVLLDGGPGYREMTYYDDGTSLINDEMAWGFGKGSNAPVFKRLQDAPSIAEHGLWQRADLAFNIWCQDTIDTLASAVVYGNPSSTRGHRNDLPSVECIVNQRLASGIRPFMAGQVARFISHEYGIDTNLPIRSQQITFPEPSTIRYEMKLSHAYDQWGFEDALPNLRNISIPTGGRGSGGDCVGVMIDDYDRSVAGGFGNASSGPTYTYPTGDNLLPLDGSVNGIGAYQCSAAQVNFRAEWHLPAPASALKIAMGEFELSYQWQVPVNSNLSGGSGPEYFGYLSVGYGGSHYAAVMVTLGAVQAILRCGSKTTDDLIGGYPYVDNAYPFFSTAFVPGDVWTVKLGVSVAAGTVSAKLWKFGDPEPGWQNTQTMIPGFAISSGPVIRSFQQPSVAVGAPMATGFWDNLGEGCINVAPNPPVSDPTAGTQTTETATKIGPSTYAVSNPIAPGTLQVWLNGTAQRPTTDFVLDASNVRWFDFTFVTLSTDKVEVCYLT